jgi:hypothetical protein
MGAKNISKPPFFRGIREIDYGKTNVLEDFSNIPLTE